MASGKSSSGRADAWLDTAGRQLRKRALSLVHASGRSSKHEAERLAFAVRRLAQCFPEPR